VVICFLAQIAAVRAPAYARQPEVEDDRVELSGSLEAQPGHAVGGSVRVVPPGREQVVEIGGNRRIVFYD